MGEMFLRYKCVKKANSIIFIPARQNAQTFVLSTLPRGQVLVWTPPAGTGARSPPLWNRALILNVLLFLQHHLLQKQSSRTSLEEGLSAFK